MRISNCRHYLLVVKKLSVFCTVATVFAIAAPAHAEVTAINFATVNQSLWGPGNAIARDGELSLPDPYLEGHLSVPDFDLSPTAALLDFLGVGSFGPSLKISPEADVTAGVTAGYHLNSGSISLNYPEQVVLDLPSAVQAGQAFSVGLRYPSSREKVEFLRGGPSAESDVPAVLAAIAGDGYSVSSLAQRFSTDAMTGVATPQAGFTTTSPYAEAYVRATLIASAKLHGEACFNVIEKICPVDGDVDLGTTSVLNNSDILKLSTLTGLSVLGQQVVDLSNAHLAIPGGIGDVYFHSPSIALSDDVLNGDGSLSADDKRQFLSLGIDVDQLVPLVGTILHNSVGPFSYSLLSVEPTLYFTLHQSVVFDPAGVGVDLHFSDPVSCPSCANSDPTRDLHLVAGENHDLFAGSGAGIIGSGLTVTPTFSLTGSLRNHTYVTLDASLDISALELTNPIHAGPACCEPIPLLELPVPLLDFNQPFDLQIPSITTATEAIDRTGFAELANITPVGIPDAAGNRQYGLSFTHLPVPVNGEDGFTTFANGKVIRHLVSGGDAGCSPTVQCPEPCLRGGIICDTYFQASSDIIYGDGVNLGRLFCIECFDAGGPPGQNPSLVDTNGDAVFFSDLHTYPYLPTAADIIDPTSPYYDSVLANSAQLFGPAETVTIAAGAFVNHPHGVAPVPEPNDLTLLGAGLLVLGGFGWKRGWRV